MFSLIFPDFSQISGQFPDISLIDVKFLDISRFPKKMAALQINSVKASKEPKSTKADQRTPTT